MLKYNLAACPVDPQVNQAMFRLAEYFQNNAAGYCLLKNGSLPHVTLCQFMAETDQLALEYVGGFLSTDFLLAPTGVFINPDNHSSAFWIGFIVRRNNNLLKTQDAVVKILQEKGSDIFNQSGNNYFPHFTLARTANVPVNLNRDIFENDLLNRPVACQVRLGHCDEMGQFTRVIA